MLWGFVLVFSFKCYMITRPKTEKKNLLVHSQVKLYQQKFFSREGWMWSHSSHLQEKHFHMELMVAAPIEC